jgi:alpha-tubulin suppressor-like RCC1 family protein
MQRSLVRRGLSVLAVLALAAPLSLVLAVAPAHASVGGVLAAWGVSSSGEANVPAGLNDAVEVSAGTSHGVARKAGGTVVAWGYNAFGQAVVPAGITTAVSVAGGETHSLAAKADGTVVAWGSTSGAEGETTVPGTAVGVVQVEAGDHFSVARLTGGTVVAWGRNSSGQTTIPGGLTGVTAVSVHPRGNHVLALKSDGTVVAWGSNSNGKATVPVGLTDVAAISAGDEHSLALKTDGTIVAWGLNSSGQLNVPAAATGATAITAGGAFSLAVRSNGQVIGWGDNNFGKASPPSHLAGVTQLSAGVHNSYALETGASYRVDNPVVVEGNAGTRNLGFTVSRLGNLADPGSVDYSTANGTALAGSDYIAKSGTLNFLAGEASKTVNVLVNGDAVQEPHETLTLPLANPIGGTILAITGAAIITNDDGAPGAGIVQAWGVGSSNETNIPSGLNDVVAIAAGSSHSLAVRSTGSLRAWGYNSNGQINVPGDLNGVVQAAGGDIHSLALRADGTVRGWGYNGEGQLNVPEGLVATQVTAGYRFSAALKPDGTVVAWGTNASGQLNVPAGLTGVTQIASGPNASHMLARKSDGTVVAWGHNGCGQSNVPAGLTNVVEVAAGECNSIARKSDGTVVVWGQSSSGQLNVSPAIVNVSAVTAGSNDFFALLPNGVVAGWGANDYGKTTIPSTVGGITRIAAGYHHVLALASFTALKVNDPVVPEGDAGTSALTFTVSRVGNVVPTTSGFSYATANGTATTAAGDYLPETGSVVFGPGETSKSVVVSVNGDTTAEAHETVILNLSNPVGSLIADASGAGTILDDDGGVDGTVAAWGRNDEGEINIPVDLGPAVQIDSGAYFSVALLPDGTVRAWGQNNYGQSSPPAGLGGVTAVSAGDSHALALRADGTVVGWGRNDFGQASPPYGLKNVKAISAGGNFSLALKTDGTVVAWGGNAQGESTVPPTLTGVVAISASTQSSGQEHALAAKSDGTVVAWGSNSHGQLNIPAGTTGVVAVAAGDLHSLALKSDGTVRAWGYNGEGQLNIPAGLTAVTGISAGHRDSFAVKGNQVIGWGANDYNKLNPPPSVGGVLSVSAGVHHVMALQTTSSLRVNDAAVDEGNHGANTMTFTIVRGGDTSGPATVKYATSNTTAVAPGDYSAVALTTVAFAAGETSKSVDVQVISDMTVEPSETLKLTLSAPVGAVLADSVAVGTPPAVGVPIAWGRNNSGQVNIPEDAGHLLAVAGGARSDHFIGLRPDRTLIGWGDNGSGEINTPPGLFNVRAIAVGADHSLAVRSDGTVAAWGLNNYGQINVPAFLSGVIAVAGGDSHSLALRADGTVIGWGRNDQGQISVPPTLTGVVAIAAGGRHSLALKSDGTVVGWGENDNGEVTVPVAGAGLTYTAIAGGGDFSMALRSNGTVAAWGYNGYGQTTIPAGLANVKTIAAGEIHSLAAKADGTVVAWGYNGEGQLNVPPSVAGVTMLAPGYRTSLALQTSSSLRVNDVSLAEGNVDTTALTFTVSRGGDPTAASSVSYAVTGLTATAGSDFDYVAPGTLSFPPGETTREVSLVVNTDAVEEISETLQIVLSAPVGATLLDATGIGTIRNDDAPAVGSVVYTSNFDAAVGAEWGGTGANVTTPAPVSATGLGVPGAPAHPFASNDSAALSLSTATPHNYLRLSLDLFAIRSLDGGADRWSITLAGGQVVQPSTSFNGCGGSQAFPDPSPASNPEGTGSISVNTLGYPAYCSGIGDRGYHMEYDIPHTSVGAQFNFAVNGLEVWDNEGILLDNITVSYPEDPQPQPPAPTTLSIADRTLAEGNAGTTNYSLTVTRAGDTTGTTTVDYMSSDGTATAGSDYVAKPLTTLTFAPGQTAKSAVIVVNGDTAVEGDETFGVTLSNAVGGTITRAQGIGKITNDDAPPTLTINDVTMNEGNTGTSIATATITRAGNLADPSTVGVATVDGTATAGSDYVSLAPTVVSFGPGETTKTVDVTINGDTVPEASETFNVMLVSPIAAAISDGTGVVTLTNDDTLPIISVANVSASEGDEGTRNLSMVVSRIGNTSGESWVTYATADGTATLADGDYAAVPATTVRFAPGETSKTVNVQYNGDTIFEPDESFAVTLSSPVLASLGTATANGTLLSDDLAPTLAVNDVAGLEGSTTAKTLTFTVTRSGKVGGTSTVQYSTLNGTASSASDYTAKPLTTLSFAAFETTKTVVVTLTANTVIEPDETFSLKLSTPVNASISDTTGIGTILNDDSTFSISPTTASVVEGDAGTKLVGLTITRTGYTGATASVTYATGGGTATGTTDYTTVSAVASFPAGTISKLVNITVKGDTAEENDETFNVTLSAPVGATTAAPTTSVITITDDDDPPVLNVADVSALEGSTTQKTLTFTVTRTGDVGGPATVDFTTASGTATAGTDYTAPTPATLSFAANVTSKTVVVNLTFDTAVEADETFTLTLSNPTASVIGDGSATGTILNDDSTFSIADTSTTEGDAGTKTMDFTVTRTGYNGAVASVKYATAAGTATVTTDYTAVVAPLTVSFAIGETSKLVSITIKGDVIPENDETFLVNLSSPVGATILTGTATGTITNDDVFPTLSVNDASGLEGNTVDGSVVFTVTRAGNLNGTTTVQYATADGTATVAGTDYTAVPLTTLTFTAGQATKTVTVKPKFDTVLEPDETFSLILSNPTFATISDDTGQGTITNDDATFSIDDVAIAEGNAGTSLMTFTVTRTGYTGIAATVKYATANGTAVAPGDYVAKALTTLSFAIGDTTKTFTVTVNGDVIDEGASEAFNVNLSAQTGAGVTISDALGVGTITDDDP